jgi:hypothetical protein
MKQTAVEWLIKELKEKEYLGTFCTADAWEREEQQMRLIIQQAKAMEKEQIKLAYSQGREDAGDFVLIEELRYIDEDYYTETYL